MNGLWASGVIPKCSKSRSHDVVMSEKQIYQLLGVISMWVLPPKN